MPQKFEDVIEQTAQKKGGHLVVSKEPKDMDGGFVLVYGGIGRKLYDQGNVPHKAG